MWHNPSGRGTAVLDSGSQVLRKVACGSAAWSTGLPRKPLDRLPVTLHDIVEELERYRGSYGDWFPHPPEQFGGEPPKASDQDPPTTEENAS